MSKDEKYSDAPVDEQDKGTAAGGLVLGGFLKGNWRDYKKDDCDCGDDCNCKDESHLKVVK